MTNPIKKQQWWQQHGIRFLGGESGSHIPTHEDFGKFGFDCGYEQGVEDSRKAIADFVQTFITSTQSESGEPTQDA
jgi:hypothetical protein